MRTHCLTARSVSPMREPVVFAMRPPQARQYASLVESCNILHVENSYSQGIALCSSVQDNSLFILSQHHIVWSISLADVFAQGQTRRTGKINPSLEVLYSDSKRINSDDPTSSSLTGRPSRNKRAPSTLIAASRLSNVTL